MSVGTADWIIATFFLAALILVRGLRKPIKTESAESYHNIAGGLTVLAFTAMARIYFSLGLFAQVPFLSETLFFDLVYWIGTITGSVLIISGVATWLPLARYHRKYNQSRIQHLDILRKVEQLVGVETRLDTILATSLQWMTEPMSLAAGAVFKCSPSRELLTLVATSKDFPIEDIALNQMTLNVASIRADEQNHRQDYNNWLGGFPSDLGNPRVALPIFVNRQPVGFFLFWDDRREEIDLDDLLTLRLATDVIARKIDTDRMILRHRSHSLHQDWQNRLWESVNRAKDTRRRFTAFVRGLSERIRFDYATLAIMGEHENTLKRLSSGVDGQVLVENGVPSPRTDTLTAAAFYKQQSLTFNDLDETDQPDRAEMLLAWQVRSLVAIPLCPGESTSAVLLLASRARAAFGSGIQRELDSLTSLLTQVVLPEAMNMPTEFETDRLERLANFYTGVSAAESESEIIATAAGMILDELDADLVRIATVDETGAFLESKAVISTRPMTGMVPANGKMILSLMPLHDQVLKSGRPMYIDPASVPVTISEIERQQVFAEGIKSVFLVPAVVRGECPAVISVAGFDPAATLLPDRSTRIFVQAVANQLAARLDRSPTRPAIWPAPAATAFGSQSDGDTRCQVRSSLTGILGSVELLKSHPAVAQDEGVNRYLSIIDRSARRIDTAVGSR